MGRQPTIVARGHRLVGGFTVNIRAIRDTAEISITCLAALILGAATSCSSLMLGPVLEDSIEGIV